MPSVPQLLDEDVQEIDRALRELLLRSEATAALLAAEGGFLISQQGDTTQFEPAALGALSANTFSATQAIAHVLNETSFAAVYQQGVQTSILIGQINRQHMLVVIFPTSTSVGAVKYFAAFAIQAIAAQLAKARERAPDKGFDLALLNLADSSDFFRSKPAAS